MVYCFHTGEVITMKKTAVIIIAILMAVTSVHWNVFADETKADALRISGDTRYSTSTHIADYYKERINKGAKLSAVVVATGENFPDALAGSYLANKHNAPIIMINKGCASTVVSYVKENLSDGGTVYVLGGTGAVPDSWLGDLKTTRFSGKDRYITNLEILKGADVSGGALLVCTGNNYADALSASGLDMPILLVGDSLTNDQRDFLSAGQWEFHIVGGTGAVSSSLENQLKQYDKDGSIDRVFGSTRYDTSEELAKKYAGGAKKVVLATGQAFPDGLCGGPVAFNLDAPIILADPGKNRENARSYVDSNSIRSGIVLGGTGRIDDATVRYIFQTAGGEEEPEYMNINSTGMDNMIWSWWYYPQVISDGNKVFWGYATNEGYCGVAQYDGVEGLVTKTALKKVDEIDDHNGLALTILDDKRIMCAYASGHNLNKEIHIRISDEPLDISSFNNDTVLESAGVTCYSQIIKSNNLYWLFYRVNNTSWAYRTSPDGREWSEETIAVKAGMQYYCRFVKTTEDGLIRIVMYSNPSQVAPEIRMGFLNTASKSIFNADGKTKLGSEKINYDAFATIIEKPEDKTQRLFDVAVTDPDDPLILYATFTGKKKVNDSIYYVYDSGESSEICKGGAPLMDPKYQLGAAFINNNSFVVARNNVGTDYIELYKYDKGTIAFEKQIDSQIGSASSRDARPIVDVNGKALLWHNGWYNNSKYTDFNTSARLYLIDSNSVICESSEGLDAEELSKPDAQTVEMVKQYSAKLFSENMTEDRNYLKGGFTWDQEYAKKIKTNPDATTRGWLYYNGFMMEALLTADPENSTEILSFYDSHKGSNGELKVSEKSVFPVGALDNIMPAAVMVRLVNEGYADDAHRTDYNKMANYAYNKLEKQIMYDGLDGRPYAGKLWLHQQIKDETTGEYVPAKSWSTWNICLDGVYMSQLYLIRLAEAIDSGDMVIFANDGHTVSSDELWDDIYTRLCFVMENMKISRTGLLAHVYSAEQQKTNDITWGRGMGWFTMVLLEAAEKMPDPEKREKLQDYYNTLMKSVLKWQDPESLLWYNVVERKDELNKNRPETSGSAMFAYCLLKGYKVGILQDEEYYKGGLAAFNAIVKNHYNEEDGLQDTLISMGPGSTENAYQNPDYVNNEAKGVAPLILAAQYAY